MKSAFSTSPTERARYSASYVASARSLARFTSRIANARAAVQVHGGVGFTWEMLPNYLLKRAWVLEHAFGDGDSHALSISASLEAALA